MRHLPDPVVRPALSPHKHEHGDSFFSSDSMRLAFGPVSCVWIALITLV